MLFYKAIIESIITASITVWYGSSDSRTKKKLERVVTKASNIGCDLPSVLSLYVERSLNRAKKIIRDSSHPSQDFFKLLPSGRCYRSMRAGTTCLNKSFFPSAIRLNSQSWPGLFLFIFFQPPSPPPYWTELHMTKEYHQHCCVAIKLYLIFYLILFVCTTSHLPLKK